MIIAKKGIVQAKGTVAELMSDLVTIVNSLNEHLSEEFDSEETKEMIMDAVNMGLASEEELKKMQIESVKEMLDELDTLLKGLGELYGGK